MQCLDQKNRGMNIAQDLLNDVNYEIDLLKRVITGDEEWIYSYGYDIETKTPSKRPEEPRPKKHAKFKQMSKFCSLFFSITMAWCISTWSINSIFWKLCTVCEKQYEEVQNGGKINLCLLHHDNALFTYLCF